MRDKPLHWSDGSATTLCNMPTPKRRYIGRWNHNEATLDLSIVTCDVCRAKLKLRKGIDPQPLPQQAPKIEWGQPAPIVTPEDTKQVIELTEASQLIEATKPTPKPAQIVASESKLNLKMLGSLGETIQEYVEARAREIAADVAIDALSQLETRGPIAVEWKVNDQPFAKIEGTHHKALPEILNRIACGFRNFYIVGPAGTGKTTLASDVAKALEAGHKRPVAYYEQACTQGMSETKLIGRGIVNFMTGKLEYQSCEFVDGYESESVILLDEIDASDSNVLLIANGATANGHMTLPDRMDNRKATRHENCIIIVAANTYGTGADRQYVGRAQLDAAFLDRFVGCTIEVDYDRDLETALVGDATILAACWSVREKVMALKLRRVVSTRFILAVARLVKGMGMPLKQALREATKGWTSDELSKVGVV